MCQDTKWVNTDGKMVTVDLLKECCHNHQFVKNTVYVKCKKAKPNKRRYTCNNVTNKIESIKSQLDGVFVWVNSRSWWWTGRPGMLRFMGSQRVGHDWATELNWTDFLVICRRIKIVFNKSRNFFKKCFYINSYRCNHQKRPSVQFGHSVVSDSLRPHESQDARPPCPSPTPGVHSNSRPSSRWRHPAISSSVVPFSFCPQSRTLKNVCLLVAELEMVGDEMKCYINYVMLFFFTTCMS